MLPSEYAARYLPISFILDGQSASASISKYRRGQVPTAWKDQLLGKLIDHFTTNSKKNSGYQLTLTIAGQPYVITSAKQVGVHVYRPFIGKGSPEECELVLQLAVMLGKIEPARLQAWADENLGLDCNGVVGNYLFHDQLPNDWWVEGGKNDPAASAFITTIFSWAAHSDESGALHDLSQVTQTDMYVIARVDGGGKVIAGGQPTSVGHIAITEPGKVVQSFAADAGDPDAPRYSKLGMIDHLAIMAVESVGPQNGQTGIIQDWLVFMPPSKGNPLPPKVFEVRRKIFPRDLVKIAPVTKRATKPSE